MTPAQVTLARRLVAAPWFPRPAADGWMWRHADGDLRASDSRGIVWVEHGAWLPDLTADATGGVLVGMPTPGWALSAKRNVDGDRWTCEASTYDGRLVSVSSSFLAEAAAAVLLEVRGG